MSGYYKIIINSDKADSIFINCIVPLLDKYFKAKSDYFYIWKQKDNMPLIDVYLDNSIDNNIEIEIENLLKKGDIQSIEKNVSFIETEGNFGIKGDKLLSNFLKDLNEVSINILTQTLPEYNKRLDLILDLMIISAHSNYGSIKNGYISYASHVNGFFTRWKDPIEIEKKFYKSYLENKELIQEKVNKLTVREIFGVNKEFEEFILKTKDFLLYEIKKGNIRVFNINEQKANVGDRDFLGKSKFHNEISKNRKFQEYMNTDYEFLSARMITVFTYLFLRNLGIKNIDRYLLCYYIYRCVEDTYKLDTLELIRNFGKENSKHVRY